jgi:hypothetical protein
MKNEGMKESKERNGDDKEGRAKNYDLCRLIRHFIKRIM